MLADFIFFTDEVDILEIRLLELNDVVDLFIIVETHYEVGRKWLLDEYMHRFKNFFSKIIYFQNTCINNEKYSCIPSIVKHFLKDVDTIIFGNINDIPNSKSIHACTTLPVQLEMADSSNKKILGSILYKMTDVHRIHANETVLGSILYKMTDIHIVHKIIPIIKNGGWSICMDSLPLDLLLHANSNTLSYYNLATFSDNGKHVAVMLESRFPSNIETVLRQFSRFLSMNWSMHLYVSQPVYELYVTLVNKLGNNIKVFRLETKLENVKEYNNILLSLSFWEQFLQFENILIFQADTMLYKSGIENFLEYDYIGAPWS